MKKRLLALALTMAPLAVADVSHTTTSQVTGGGLLKLASIPMVGGKIREALKPQTTQTALKGNRLATRGATSGNIIDLDAETMTNINFDAKTYSVMTFKEFEERMEKAMSNVKTKSGDAGGKPSDAKMELDFDVKETGRTQTIDGFNCREMIVVTKMTGTDPQTGQSGEYRIRNVMWMTKTLPGTEEARDFYMKMAQKMKFQPGATMDALPGFGVGLAELKKKASLMEGTAIVSTVTIGGEPDSPPEDVATTTAAIRQADEARMTQKQSAGSSSMSGSQAAAAAIGAAIPGFGGFGRKKKDAPPPPPADSPAVAGSAADSVLMSMRTTDYDFSTSSADASMFEVPAGFKKVDSK